MNPTKRECANRKTRPTWIVWAVSALNENEVIFGSNGFGPWVECYDVFLGASADGLNLWVLLWHRLGTAPESKEFPWWETELDDRRFKANHNEETCKLIVVRQLKLDFPGCSIHLRFIWCFLVRFLPSMCNATLAPCQCHVKVSVFALQTTIFGFQFRIIILVLQ